MEHKNRTYDSTYVFSADRQEEVKKIYQKYSPQAEGKKKPSEEDEKMELLRKLDQSVTRVGTIAALLNGTVGAVVHGIGVMLVHGETRFALGTVIAVAGLALFLASYPVYCMVMKKRRRMVKTQILTLCKELMK